MNRNRKIVLIVLVAAIVVALMFAVDSVMPDPVRRDDFSEWKNALHRVKKIGVALAKYIAIENSASYPENLSVLALKGYLEEPDALTEPGENRSSSYVYYPRITPDMPLGLTVLWTKKSYKAKARNWYHYLRNDGTVGYDEERKAREVRSAQLKARGFLFSDRGTIAGEIERFIHIRAYSKNRNVGLQIACACWRLGRLGTGHAALMRALRNDNAKFDAARALAELGDDTGAGILENALFSDQFPRRRQAFNALRKLGVDLGGYNPHQSKQVNRERIELRVKSEE